MFRPTINNTPLTSQMANSYFQNIYGDNFNSDVTFVSTLRALVANRIKDDERVVLKFRNSSFDKDTIEGASDRNVLNAVCNPTNYENGTIIVHNFRGNAQGNLASFKVVERGFTSEYSGFERIVKVTEFFRKTFYSLCFVNPNTKHVVIFIDNLNIRRMHYLQCAIFAFMLVF